LSINALGLGLPWTIKNIYKKYDEEKNMEWCMSNKIWKEYKEEYIIIQLHFSNERINIIV
jgi:hypothetical protein